MTHDCLVHGLDRIPNVRNEFVFDYAPRSPERASLKMALRQLSDKTSEMQSIINGKPVLTGRLEPVYMPHEHRHILGCAHLAGATEIDEAIAAACQAWPEWSRTSWQRRAAIFLKAADLLAGPWRQTLNAATMLGQSKTAYQAEIDSAAELIDFWRFNVDFMLRIYSEQPSSSPGIWNKVDYRPLEGFIYAATPFNFTAIAGNLASAPALVGNTVVWKPSTHAKLSASIIMQILQAAGLPDGVINLVYGDPGEVSDRVISDPRLAGVHFTGSTAVFRSLTHAIAQRKYRSYPRIVGETGGKNFIVAHSSADIDTLATSIIRGAFEYQGQKCSAASRVFVPESLWPALRERLADEIAGIRVGDVCDFRNFMGAVIHETAWRRLDLAISAARSEMGNELVAGGTTDSSVGYFVNPTVFRTVDVRSALLTEELFGPIVGVFVYSDRRFGEMLHTIDEACEYGLTGAIFSEERDPIDLASNVLRHTAGNFYINDKPTGAVVGQQPFGGGRASGSNDKAGSIWNLMRWVSPRAIKETFNPPREYRYPHMDSDE
jgi:1-pyrroline-5-carboxylate dehydrogenase